MPFTRRRLVESTAAALAAATAANLGPIDWPAQVLAEARAAEPDTTRDAINGFVAFIVPGSDVYSKAQGVTVPGPGGIGAGATDPVIAIIDRVMGDAAGNAVPSSAATAGLLESAAKKIDPNASRGGFASNFSRLSFDQKLAAIRGIETDPALASVAGLLSSLPALVGLTVYSEVAVLDRRTRVPRRRPVGWRLTNYAGSSDGWPELRGYYGGRRKASG